MLQLAPTTRSRLCHDIHRISNSEVSSNLAKWGCLVSWFWIWRQIFTSTRPSFWAPKKYLTWNKPSSQINLTRKIDQKYWNRSYPLQFLIRLQVKPPTSRYLREAIRRNMDIAWLFFLWGRGRSRVEDDSVQGKKHLQKIFSFLKIQLVKCLIYPSRAPALRNSNQVWKTKTFLPTCSKYHIQFSSDLI